MNRSSPLFSLFTLALLTPLLSSAAPVSIPDGVILDNYIGAGDGDGSNRDVVGGSKFHVDSLHASLSGETLTVRINTAFAGHGGIFPNLTYGNTGVGYGDLFLSSGWNPAGDQPYLLDDFSNGNRWAYALSMDEADRFIAGDNSGNATLYQLPSDYGRDDIRLSDDFISINPSHYRENQEVAVNLASTSNSIVDTSVAEWLVDSKNDFLEFSVDLSNTGLLDAGNDSLGLRWTMACGNDAIEGQVGLLHSPIIGAQGQAPTPGTIALAMLGGIGLIAVKRHRRRQRA